MRGCQGALRQKVIDLSRLGCKRCHRDIHPCCMPAKFAHSWCSPGSTGNRKVRVVLSWRQPRRHPCRNEWLQSPQPLQAGHLFYDLDKDQSAPCRLPEERAEADSFCELTLNLTLSIAAALRQEASWPWLAQTQQQQRTEEQEDESCFEMHGNHPTRAEYQVRQSN